MNSVTDTLAKNFSFGEGLNTAVAFFTVLFLVLLAVVAAVVVWFFYKKFSLKKKHDFLVHIYYQEPGSGTPIFKLDKGGIYTNARTGLKRFYLLKNNVGLNPDKVPFIFDGAGHKVVTLWQWGLKNFSFVNPVISANPGFVLSVGEEDVNWAIATFSEWKNRFQFKSFLEKYGHMFLWAVTVLGTMFIFWFVTQKFDVLQGAATALDNAATALRDASMGTVVK